MQTEYTCIIISDVHNGLLSIERLNILYGSDDIVYWIQNDIVTLCRRNIHVLSYRMYILDNET